MVRLRPYKLSDGEYIIKWIDNDLVFTQWCANMFAFPLTKEQLDQYYERYEVNNNGWLMTAIDKKGIPIGHILMRLANYEKESIHFGFIIVDSTLRGQGIGKEMVELAIEYAFQILKVKRITLGVFDNNPGAHDCYKKVGFINEEYIECTIPGVEEKWNVYMMAIEKK